AVRMIICVSGHCSFNRTVHSMPDIRGRKMSIRIASGRTPGMTRTASSPLLQTQAHAKSGNELINRHQLSRTFGWSSTRATLSGVFWEAATGRFPTRCEGVGSALDEGIVL